MFIIYVSLKCKRCNQVYYHIFIFSLYYLLSFPLSSLICVHLISQVNELSYKIHQLNVADRLSSTSCSEAVITNAYAAEPSSGSIESAPGLSYKAEPQEIIEVKEEKTRVTNGHARPAASTDSIGEIVQISLDDPEIQEVESQDVESTEPETVPLVDAPLIGAPFRFVSFVASYVSGADLVNNNS